MSDNDEYKAAFLFFDPGVSQYITLASFIVIAKNTGDAHGCGCGIK